MLAVFTHSFLIQTTYCGSVYLTPTGGTSNDFELSAPAPGRLLLYPKAMHSSHGHNWKASLASGVNAPWKASASACRGKGYEYADNK
jgi:hypothetical protein